MFQQSLMECNIKRPIYHLPYVLEGGVNWTFDAKLC